MTEDIGQVVTATSGFTREHSIEPRFFFHTVEQLSGEVENQDHYWAKFEKQAGGVLPLQSD